MNNLSYSEILKAYIFSDKFYRLFAVACAKYAISFVKNPDARAIKAITVAEAYANGQATEAELKKARDDAYAAYNAAHDASYAAYYVSYAASFAASYTAYNASVAAYNAAYNAAYANPKGNKVGDKDIKQLLIDMIKKEYTELELLCMGIVV